jgi:hypothetical protein
MLSYRGLYISSVGQARECKRGIIIIIIIIVIINNNRDAFHTSSQAVYTIVIQIKWFVSYLVYSMQPI